MLDTKSDIWRCNRNKCQFLKRNFILCIFEIRALNLNAHKNGGRLTRGCSSRYMFEGTLATYEGVVFKPSSCFEELWIWDHDITTDDLWCLFLCTTLKRLAVCGVDFSLQELTSTLAICGTHLETLYTDATGDEDGNGSQVHDNLFDAVESECTSICKGSAAIVFMAS